MIYYIVVRTKKVGEFMGIKKGTKLSDNPKTDTFKFRLDENTNKKLEEISITTGKSKSEIIRNGIDIQHNAIKNSILDVYK
jgi:hypothetical protein